MVAVAAAVGGRYERENRQRLHRRRIHPVSDPRAVLRPTTRMPATTRAAISTTSSFSRRPLGNPAVSPTNWFRPKLARMKLSNIEEQEKIATALTLQLAQIDDRLNRLTDAYIDRLIEKNLFEQRKSALLVERTDVEQRLTEWKSGKRNPADELLFFLERADSAYLAYKLGLTEEKRDLLDSVTSNRLVSGRTPEIMLGFALQ